MKKIIKYFIIITIIVVSALILIYYSFAMRHIYDINIIELGDECYWYDAGREDIVPRRGRIIPPVVQNYSYNKDYIIAASCAFASGVMICISITDLIPESIKYLSVSFNSFFKTFL